MRYLLRNLGLWVYKVMKVKYAGPKQQPIPTTNDVAFEIKDTIRRNTARAITKALGFIPVFL